MIVVLQSGRIVQQFFFGALGWFFQTFPSPSFTVDLIKYFPLDKFYIFEKSNQMGNKFIKKSSQVKPKSKGSGATVSKLSTDSDRVR